MVLERINYIIDTSVLLNFVATGQAKLLINFLQEPIAITPSIIEPAEIKSLNSNSYVFKSEFLRQLNPSTNKNFDITALKNIRNFTKNINKLWLTVELTSEELELARLFNNSNNIQKLSNNNIIKRKLGIGEAEISAVAKTRNLVALIDDQAAIALMKNLYPTVTVWRTCEILIKMVEIKLITCPMAEKLFNKEMVEKYGFIVNKKVDGKRQKLIISCDSANCRWIDA